MASTAGAERETKKKRCAYRPCSPHTDLLLSAFSFPNDPERTLIWLRACNRLDLANLDIKKLHNNHALCEKHFEEKYISKGSTRKTLFAEAVPTLFKHIAGQEVTKGLAENINFIKDVAPVESSHALLGNFDFSMPNKISCIVPECTFKSNGEKSIFKLPKNDARLKNWLLACGREDLLVNESDIHNNYGICEQHFESKYIANNTNNTQRILLSNARPTIFPKLEHKISDEKASIETPAKKASDKTLKNKNLECIDLTTEEKEFKTPAKKVKTTTIKLKPSVYFQKSSGIRQMPSKKRPIILRKTVKPKIDVSNTYLCNPSKSLLSNQASTSILKPVSSNSPLWAAPISGNQVNAKSSGLVGIVPTNKPNTIFCFTPLSTCVPTATVQAKPFIYFAPVNAQPNTPDEQCPVAVSKEEKKTTETAAKNYIATAHDILNVQDKNAEVFVLEKRNFEHDSSNEKTDSTELMEIMEVSSQNKTINKEIENKHVEDGQDVVQIQDDFNSKNDATNTVVESLGADNVNPFTLRIKSIGMLSSKTDSVKTGIQNSNLNKGKKVSTQEKTQTTAKSNIAAAHNKPNVPDKNSEVIVFEKPTFGHDSDNKTNHTESEEIMEISDCEDKTINKEIKNKHKNDVKILNSSVLNIGKEAGLDSASNLHVEIQDDFNSKNDATLNPDNVNPFTVRIKNIDMLSSKKDSANKGIQNNNLNRGKKGKHDFIKKIDSTELKKLMETSSCQIKIVNNPIDDVKICNSNTTEKKAGIDSAVQVQKQNDFNSKNDAINKVVEPLRADKVNPFTVRIKPIEIEGQESMLKTYLKKREENIDRIKSCPIVLNDYRSTQRTNPLNERHQSYINQMFCTFSGCTRQWIDTNSNFHPFPDEINCAIHWLLICKRPDILCKSRPEIKTFCGYSVGVCSIHKKVIDKQIDEDGSRYLQGSPVYKHTPPPPAIFQKETIAEEAEEEIDLYNAYVPTKGYCAIISCSTYASDPIKKYRFPSDPDLLAAWTKAAGICIQLTEEQYRSFFVCRKHFDESQFTELGTLILTSVPHPHTEFVDPIANEEKAQKKKQNTTGVAKKPLKTMEKVSPPKKNVCVIKHCGAVGPTNRLYSFPDPVKEQLKFLDWARAVENKKTLTLQLMDKYAGAEICIKHFEKKYQIGGLFIKNNAIPSLDLFEDNSPEKKQNTEQPSTIAVPAFLETYNLPPIYQPQKIIVEPEPEALKSYHMTPEEENASGPVWKTWDTNDNSKSEPSRDTQVKGNAKLYRNGIEFLNIRRALKYGKKSPKIEPFNFPYKVVRSKRCIRYGRQNLDHGFRMQIHTAIIVDDDDECEREAIAAITSVVAKNASIIPKRPPRRPYGKSKTNVVNR